MIPASDMVWGPGVGAPIQKKQAHSPTCPFHPCTCILISPRSTHRQSAMIHGSHFDESSECTQYTVSPSLLHKQGHTHYTCLVARYFSSIWISFLMIKSPQYFPPGRPMTSQQGRHWCAHCVCWNQPPKLIKYGSLLQCVTECGCSSNTRRRKDALFHAAHLGRLQRARGWI